MVLLSKVAFIESGSPDTVVSAPVVLDGGDGATRTGFSIEPIELILEDGQLVWQKADYQLQLAGLRGSSSNETQLATWADGQTELSVVGVGTGFIFHGSGYLNVDTSVAEGAATWRFHMTKQSVRGYKDGSYISGMVLAENGFADYLWGDSDASGKADGWSEEGTGTFSFADGEQTIEADENTAALIREMVYPFPGQNLTFSVDVLEYVSAANLTRTIEMEYQNAAGAEISTDSTTFTGTGIKSVSGKVPAATHSIVFRVQIVETGTGAASISFRNASLRNDGSTTYIPR